MDMDKLRMMLGRRGYIFFFGKEWRPLGVHDTVMVYRETGAGVALDPALVLSDDWRETARLLDIILGGGQHHMQHDCGHPVLREVRNGITIAYRSAAAGPLSQPLLECPHCQQYVQDDSVQNINDRGVDPRYGWCT